MSLMIFGIGIYVQLVWPLDSGKTSPWAFSQLIDAHVDLKQCFFSKGEAEEEEQWDEEGQVG